MCVSEIGFQFHTSSTKEDILSEKKDFWKKSHFYPKISILGNYLGNDTESSVYANGRSQQP